MAPEIRSILRYMDDYISSGEYSQAIEKGIQALHAFDQDREYENSITLLEKMVSIAEIQNEPLEMAKYVDNMRVRALLNGDHERYQQINLKYENLPETPIRTLLQEDGVSGEHITVETIERQTIFGEFEPLADTPYLTFSDTDEAVQIIEDFYDDGRYILNLLNRNTSLHQQINLDVGNPEDVNILDRNRIFRFS